MNRHIPCVLLGALLLTLALTGPGRAQSTGISVTDLGGGVYQYDLNIDNRWGLEPVNGLTVLYGGSMFGLDPGSSIKSPGGWDYFAPDPGFGIDDLDYFSLAPEFDAQIGGRLSGFRFLSATPPDTLPGGVEVELIGSDTGTVVLHGLAGGELGVTAYADPVSGRLFRYRLTVCNEGGLAPLNGLNILNGGSVFGLDGSSLIQPASGWDYFAPDPGFGIDELSFFSLSPDADVPIGLCLSGFSFFSPLDPLALAQTGFGVELIESDFGTRVFLGNAQVIPEPSSLALCTMGCGSLLLARARRRGRRPVD